MDRCRPLSSGALLLRLLAPRNPQPDLDVALFQAERCFYSSRQASLSFKRSAAFATTTLGPMRVLDLCRPLSSGALLLRRFISPSDGRGARCRSLQSGALLLR